MRRRVPCEQLLHTGQSILSPRRTPMCDVRVCLLAERISRRRAKGNQVPIPEPRCGTVYPGLSRSRSAPFPFAGRRCPRVPRANSSG